MGLGFDRFIDLGNLALWIYQVGHPFGALVFTPEGFFQPSDLVELDDIFVLIGQQRKGQLIFLFKLFVAGNRIDADPQDLAIKLK